MKKIYKSYNTAESAELLVEDELEMLRRNGQVVEILSEPDEGMPEALVGIVPPFYQVRFEDGFESGAFADELFDID